MPGPVTINGNDKILLFSSSTFSDLSDILAELELSLYCRLLMSIRGSLLCLVQEVMRCNYYWK